MAFDRLTDYQPVVRRFEFNVHAHALKPSPPQVGEEGRGCAPSCCLRSGYARPTNGPGGNLWPSLLASPLPLRSGMGARMDDDAHSVVVSRSTAGASGIFHFEL
jgi:hypothetical protein